MKIFRQQQECGDYMAPCTKEIFPATVGPTKYCPPRHFGGEKVVWQDVMRWSNAADRAGKGCNYRRKLMVMMMDLGRGM